jgi:hypothetical protein
MTNLTPIAPRLAALIRMLSTTHDGELIAAAKALNRALTGAGLDIHALAEIVEHPKKFDEQDARKIYERAFELGRRKAHEELPATFRGVGEPSWHEIAIECQEHAERLRPNEHEFVADMVRRTVHGGELTEKQGNWLRAIYNRGGRP